MANGNWQHAAYLDCAINLTNESVFNTYTQLNGKSTFLPWPYLTEKTWKPLLAGRPFVPVGQTNTLTSLKNLGLKFDYQMDLSFDLIRQDFDRIINIYKLLEYLKNLTAIEIYNQTIQSCMYNLNHIKSGNFRTACDQVNDQSFEEISKW